MSKDAITRDEMGYENLPEYLGYLIGAPLRPACLACPYEAERYRKEQAQQECFRRTITV
jgi:hypothetical protein